jgi:hypothetical protein
MSKSKRKGTAWETDIVRYLAPLFPDVERRALEGVNDRGDVAGVPGVVIEAKNCRELTLAGWVDEMIVEVHNASARIGVVWHKRRGKASPADAYVTMTGRQFVEILVALGVGQHARALPTHDQLDGMREIYAQDGDL